MSTPAHYTVDTILQSLGYPDVMAAARQQARMILLGRLARYQAAIKELESKRTFSLTQMQVQYEQEGWEDYEVDDDYVTWQWYADAVAVIESQLEILASN